MSPLTKAQKSTCDSGTDSGSLVLEQQQCFMWEQCLTICKTLSPQWSHLSLSTTLNARRIILPSFCSCGNWGVRKVTCSRSHGS